MALPKVTPGTYNYGAYANPTPIRYKGGQEAIGAAIGQGLAAAGQMIGQKKKEAKLKAKQDKAVVDKIIADTYSRASKEAREQNAEQVMNFANQAGELELQFRNEEIDRDTYIKKSTAIQDGLQNLNLLQELEKNIDLEDVSPSIIKNQRSFENYLLQKSLESNSAKRIWNGEEGEWYIEYEGVNTEKLDVEEVKNLNAIPDEAYETRRIKASEIAANPKNFFEIQTKIDFNDEPMVDLFAKTAKVFDKTMGDMYKTGVVNGYQVLDEDAAADAFAKSAQVNAIYNKIGKDVAEDILDEEFTGSEEQEAEIKRAISEQVIGYAEKQGNKAPVETTARPEKIVDQAKERTGMDLRERAVAFDRIQNLKPGESIEIKFTGTNDFRKENYIVGRSESGQIMFQREDQEEPSVISQEDLIKEFGVQSLLVDQKAQQAGLKF